MLKPKVKQIRSTVLPKILEVCTTSVVLNVQTEKHSSGSFRAAASTSAEEVDEASVGVGVGALSSNGVVGELSSATAPAVADGSAGKSMVGVSLRAHAVNSAANAVNTSS